MRKYGKYIKKTRRTFRKTSRFARKARRVRSAKRFNRRVNNVGEKKMTQIELANIDLVAATSTAAIDDGIIKALIPPSGSGTSQRIGNKIFIRYVRVNLWYTPTSATRFNQGRVGLLIAKERTPRKIHVMEVQEFFHSGYPITKDNLLKNQLIKKVYLKLKNVDPNSTVLPKAVQFKFKFKIMKTCTIDSAGVPSLPDIYLMPVYFAAPFSEVGVDGPSRVFGQYTMTYTDV